MHRSDNPIGGWSDKGHAGKSAGNRRRDPQRPYASHLGDEMMRWSDPYGDVGRLANADPLTAECATAGSHQVTASRSEIPCRVDELPLERVISPANPANNGESLLAREGDPVGSRERLLFDPVTTEAKAEMTFLPHGKSMNVIRRRPFEPMIDIPSYISGYVDGEGCFCVSLRPQPRIRVGWEVRPSFSVSQNEDRAELIRLLPTVFGGGAIRPDRSDKTLKFEIRSLPVLMNSVIPFFEIYPLLSSKRNDFELFRRICVSMQRGDHLSSEGLLEIASLAEQMNGGVRKYTVESIRISSKVKG
jgi:hypothetical protein